MRVLFFISCLLLAFLPGEAQNYKCSEYPAFINDAKQAVKDSNYVLAVQKYLAALDCDPKKAAENKLEDKITDIFDRIERLKIRSRQDSVAAKTYQADMKISLAKTQKVLAEYYFTEAELRLGESDFRLAYLLAKQALQYDAQLTAAQALLDSLVLVYPFKVLSKNKIDEHWAVKDMNLPADWLAEQYRPNEELTSTQIITGTPYGYIVCRDSIRSKAFFRLFDLEKRKITWEVESFISRNTTQWVIKDIGAVVVFTPAASSSYNSQANYILYSYKENRILHQGQNVRYCNLFAENTCWIEYRMKGSYDYLYSYPDFSLRDSFRNIRTAEEQSDRSLLLSNDLEEPDDSTTLRLYLGPKDTITGYANFPVNTNHYQVQRAYSQNNAHPKLLLFNPPHLFVLDAVTGDTLLYQNDLISASSNIERYYGEVIDQIQLFVYSDISDTHDRYSIYDLNDLSKPFWTFEIGDSSTIRFDHEDNFTMVTETTRTEDNFVTIFDSRHRIVPVLTADGVTRPVDHWTIPRFPYKGQPFMAIHQDTTYLLRADSLPDGTPYFRLQSAVKGLPFDQDEELSTLANVDSLFFLVTRYGAEDFNVAIVDSAYRLYVQVAIKGKFDRILSVSLGKYALLVNTYYAGSRVNYLVPFQSSGETRIIRAPVNVRAFGIDPAKNYWLLEVERLKDNLLYLLKWQQDGKLVVDSLSFDKIKGLVKTKQKEYLLYSRFDTLFTFDIQEFRHDRKKTWPDCQDCQVQNSIVAFRKTEPSVRKYQLILYNLETGKSKTYDRNIVSHTFYQTPGDPSGVVVAQYEADSTRTVEILSLRDFSEKIPTLRYTPTSRYGYDGLDFQTFTSSWDTLLGISLKRSDKTTTFYNIANAAKFSLSNVIGEKNYLLYTDDTKSGENKHITLYRVDFSKFVFEKILSGITNTGFSYNNLWAETTAPDGAKSYHIFSISEKKKSIEKITVIDSKPDRTIRFDWGYLLTVEKGAGRSLLALYKSDARIVPLLDAKEIEITFQIDNGYGYDSDEKRTPTLIWCYESVKEVMWQSVYWVDKSGHLTLISRHPKPSADKYESQTLHYVWEDLLGEFVDPAPPGLKTIIRYKGLKNVADVVPTPIDSMLRVIDYSFINNKQSILFYLDGKTDNVAVCRSDTSFKGGCRYFTLQLDYRPPVESIAFFEREDIFVIKKPEGSNQKTVYYDIFSTQTGRILRRIPSAKKEEDLFDNFYERRLNPVNASFEVSYDRKWLLFDETTVYSISDPKEFRKFYEEQRFTKEEAIEYGIEYGTELKN